MTTNWWRSLKWMADGNRQAPPREVTRTVIPSITTAASHNTSCAVPPRRAPASSAVDTGTIVVPMVHKTWV
jgi:hypothetical protein